MMYKSLLHLLILCLLGSNAFATWSIVVVNRRTGEVAVASATCLQRVNLRRGLPVLRLGKGAGAIQASSGGEDGLVIMFDLFDDDLDSASVLAAVLAADLSPVDRQIGVVSMVGPPRTFTGTRTGRVRGGVRGEFGDYAYAIQGNVITGQAVFRMAESALINTPGDLATKLMAGMEAARAQGGDGRCSCDQNRPFGCGAPPPSFTKSAHVGFMLIGRIGDVEANCDLPNRCADGQYYMALNVFGNQAQMSSPDPVFQLQGLYATWRAERAGRPDGALSQVNGVQALPADGISQRSYTIQLVDLEGVPLSAGGADVQVGAAPGSSLLSSVGPVQDNGDGSYSFTLTAGSTPGAEQLMVSADDGFLKATLFPYLDVRSDAQAPLHIGYDGVSAALNPQVPLLVNVPSAARSRYFLLASLAGSNPGTVFGELQIPLNRPLLHPSFGQFSSPVLSGQLGHLDANGRAETQLQLPASVPLALVGSRVDWSALIFGHGQRQVTPAVGFDILP
jgi:hypothetical protein